MVLTRKRRRELPSNLVDTASYSYVCVTAAAVRHYRLHASHLLPCSRLAYRDNSLAELCARLFGIQAQDPSAAALSLFNRLSFSEGVSAPSISDLRAAFSSRTAEHGIIRCHGQRCTLHLYDIGTWPIAAAAVRDRILKGRERVVGAAELEAGRKRLAKRLGAGKAVTAKDLQGSEFSVRYSAFLSVTFRGLGARTDVSGGVVIAPRKHLVPAQSPKWEMPEFREALRHAAKVYFSAFGPATEQDFRYYFGLVAAVSKEAVTALREGGELVEVRVATGDEDDALGFGANCYIAEGCVSLLSRFEEARGMQNLEAAPLMLLGKYDVLMLGHADKAWIVPPDMKQRVWSKNAEVRAVVVVRGRTHGTWSYKLSRKGAENHLAVSVNLFPGTDWNEKSDFKELKGRVGELAEHFFLASTWDIDVAVV